MLKIYYLVGSGVISGGHHVIVDHVNALIRLGIDANILAINEDIALKYIEFVTPKNIKVISESILNDGNSFLVLPEPWKEMIDYCRKYKIKKILHVQNPYYIFHGFENIFEINSYGFSGLMCCSHFTKQELEILGVKINPCVINPQVPEIFSPGENKLDRICYMPRKRSIEVRYLIGLYSSLFYNNKFEWKSLDGLTRNEVAIELNQSKIFISTGYLEGLGLPPLEAIAAGCAVVGYRAGGGNEYAISENGVWVEEGNHFKLVAAINAFENKLSNINANESDFINRQSRLIKEKYSHASFVNQLKSFWLKMVK